jgi:hypothetical protein
MSKPAVGIFELRFAICDLADITRGAVTKIMRPCAIANRNSKIANPI